MSTVTEVEQATEQKFNRRAFTTEIINRHRNAHNVHPTERMAPEHYEHLGNILAEQANLEVPKAVAYVKNLDATLRSNGGSKAQVASADVPGISSQRVPGGDETVSEFISRMRTEEASSKEEIIKALYDVYENEVTAGSMSVALITAVVSHVFKQLKTSKAAKKSEGGVPLNDLCLAKYDELLGKYGAEATDNRNRLTGVAADEFNTWYEETRGGKVGNVERTGERMAEHAQWHLNRLLKAQGRLGAYVREAKPAPAEGEAKPKRSRKKAEAETEASE